MAKKKKMTKAQAAAARRDDRPKRPTNVKAIKDEGPKSKDTKTFQLIIPIVCIIVVVLLSIVFTIGPGLMLDRQ